MIKEQYYNNEADELMQLYFKEDPSLETRPQFHDAIEFIIMTEGSAEAYNGDSMKVISEGDIFFAESYESHHYKQLSESLKAFVIVISRDYLKSFRELYPDSTLPTYMLDKDFNNTLIPLIRKWKERENNTTLFNNGCISLLFSSLISNYSMVKRKDCSDDVLVKDLIKYIHSHYLDDINLRDMAYSFGYTVEYCSKTLKKAIRCNFREYVNMLRLRKANELLNDKSLNLTQSEILYSCGFSSPATYYRVKKQFEKE